MTFKDANKILDKVPVYIYQGVKEEEALASFGIKLDRSICVKCNHLGDRCKGLSYYADEYRNCIIKSCNYFESTNT